MGNTKKRKKKKNKNTKSNFITILGGITLGFVLVFAIIAVDVFSKMNIISFGNNKTGTDDPTGFVEVTEAGEEELVLDTLEELRGQNNLSSMLKNWAENTSEKSLMQSKDVINFLLIGLDASDTNSDAIFNQFLTLRVIPEDHAHNSSSKHSFRQLQAYYRLLSHNR